MDQTGVHLISASSWTYEMLDISKPRQFGKQSERVRTQAKVFGYMIDSTRIEIDQESPASAAAAASR